MFIILNKVTVNSKIKVQAFMGECVYTKNN